MLTRLRPSSYLEGRWEGKGTYVFYLELVTDLLHLCVYVVFFFIVFTNYGLPLHLARAARPPCPDLPLRPVRPMRPRCCWVHERKLAPWLAWTSMPLHGAGHRPRMQPAAQSMFRPCFCSC